jgi:hypothetical protein
MHIDMLVKARKQGRIVRGRKCADLQQNSLEIEARGGLHAALQKGSRLWDGTQFHQPAYSMAQW